MCWLDLVNSREHNYFNRANQSEPIWWLQVRTPHRAEPPNSYANLHLVAVHPVIQVPNQLVGAPLGTDVQIECHVEASPKSINYWIKDTGKWVRAGAETSLPIYIYTYIYVRSFIYVYICLYGQMGTHIYADVGLRGRTHHYSNIDSNRSAWHCH